MENKVLVFGNYLMSNSFVVEENLNLRKVHETLNHWSINKIDGKLDKYENGTVVRYLDNGLVVFESETATKDTVKKENKVPNLIIDNIGLYGLYLIARMKDNEFITLTEEDIAYIENCAKNNSKNG